MKRIVTAITLIIASLYSQSCKHPDCHGTGGAVLDFEGFDSTMLEKVTIKEYRSGSNFSEQLDSNTYLLSAYANTIYRYDSQSNFIIWPYHSAIGLNDAIIEIAATGKTYRLKDITPTNAKNEIIGGFLNSGGASSKECYNVIESYSLDGKVINTNQSPSYGVGSGTNISINP